ncbi:MAG: hypothetical protein KA149_08970 [Chitinophagales bacterium]|nr:hypothetical protein [Chitinophagales bacterium]
MKSIKLSVVLLFCILSLQPLVAQKSISIIYPPSLNDTSITVLAINDAQQLLKQACGCEVSLNNTSADVLLKLPAIDKKKAAELNRFAKEATFPYSNYPEHGYTWQLKNENQKIVLELTATSWQGVSFGLYGLLQEKLGFKFYHPRRMKVPNWTNFPLQQAFTWQAKALFDKHGFHLHTQHPLELTEQLHDGTLPNALQDIKEYIDWLARNGQNYFEFCLLENIDRKEWPAHAKAITDYCHQRGILAAVDLSLHMIQQKTFQLYKGPVAKQKQVEKNLVWLMTSDWDFINMEFSTAEFISGNQKKKEELRLFILAWLKQNSHAKLMGRQHVVRHKSKPGKKHNTLEWDSATQALDKERGVLSHTVMFYDMTEPNAPVYENKNQRHMFDFLLQQMKVRETWYYPESAYWVTSDNAVPMFLMPYLNARLADIDTCVKYKVPGHLTFSSGWEWGYWLFDWSIARWSWQHTTDGVAQKRTATMYANELFTLAEEGELFERTLDLQQHYLKDRDLFRWMTAMSITDEISIKALNDAYHPRPQWSYKFLQNKADSTILKQVSDSVLHKLDDFSGHTAALVFLLKHEATELFEDAQGPVKPDLSVQNEFMDGLAITGLRAKHKSFIMQFIICKRTAAIEHRKCNCDSLLNYATETRKTALQIVKNREAKYRYPLASITTKRWNHTSYGFGYLYTVSNLHFWHREEEQARKNKYSPTFLNIYNMFRIAGIIN